MGQILFFHHFLNERVRSGARYAVVHPYDPAAIKNVVAYNTPGPIPDGGRGLFGLEPSMLEVNRLDPGTPHERIEVSVRGYTLRVISPWLARTLTPGPFRAVAPIESGGFAP
jgi:hypothetical protein